MKIKENKIEEKCPSCGAIINDKNKYLGYCNNPYIREIDGEEVKEEFCERCYEEAGDEI